MRTLLSMERMRMTTKPMALLLGGLMLLFTARAEVRVLREEFSLLGRQTGDQFLARVALHGSGGYLVWEDNHLDGDGTGIGAVALDGNLSATLGAFRVNQETGGEQRRPALALRPGGGVVFAWQGGGDVRMRLMDPDGLFEGPEFRANSWTLGVQEAPAAATLESGRVVVVWNSMGQDGDMLGVFARVFDPSGRALGEEFMVNRTTSLNQRDPAVAALPGDRFVVAWISERPLHTRDHPVEGGERYQVAVHGRIFDALGRGVTGELLWGGPDVVDANPALLALDDGFAVFTSGRSNLFRILDPEQPRDGWDIYGRILDPDGIPRGERFRINEYTFHHQMGPAAALVEGRALVTWMSYGQDGDREGIYGRLIRPEAPGESLPETSFHADMVGSQLFPGASGNGERAMVVWASYSGGPDSYDLRASTFAADGSTAVPVSAPYVFATGFDSLGISWPAIEGAASYEVRLDDHSTPYVTTRNRLSVNGLLPGSAHTVHVVPLLEDGDRGTPLAPGSGSTWGADGNDDGLPDSWQRGWWGEDASLWPDGEGDADGDGADNRQELLAGTNPVDPASRLEIRIVDTDAGHRLEWDAVPGAFYQIQFSADVRTWSDAGSPRMAPGETDSISISGEENTAFYRLLRVQ